MTTHMITCTKYPFGSNALWESNGTFSAVDYFDASYFIMYIIMDAVQYITVGRKHNLGGKCFVLVRTFCPFVFFSPFKEKNICGKAEQCCY